MRKFKSREGYGKWLAYGHMRTKTGLPVSKGKGRKSLFEATPGVQKVSIKGKLHEVKHDDIDKKMKKMISTGY